MIIFSKLKLFMSKVISNDSCDISDININNSKSVAQVSKELDIVEKKRLDIERRLDEIQATIDGDPNWFRKLNESRIHNTVRENEFNDRFSRT